jgi:hypothetical protein
MKQLPVWLAFGFGVVFLSALLVLAVAIPNPTDRQFEIFKTVIAAAIAGVAAVIPGLLNVRMSQGRGFVVTASGALAVFLIVYFYSPARWVTNPLSPSSDRGSPNTSAPRGAVNQHSNVGNQTINNIR